MPSVGKLLASGEKEGGSYPGYADVYARRGGRELRVLLSKCPHLVLAVNLDLNREEDRKSVV